MDLKIKDPDEWHYGDGVTATWTLSNMKPGEEISGWVRLRNKGSIRAKQVEINVGNVINDPEGPESDVEENTNDLDKQMMIEEMKYYTSPGVAEVECLSLLRDKNNNGYKDLDDLETQGIRLDSSIPNFFPPTSFTAKDIKISFRFNPGAGNGYQGDILISTFTFTLKQDS